MVLSRWIALDGGDGARSRSPSPAGPRMPAGLPVVLAKATESFDLTDPLIPAGQHFSLSVGGVPWRKNFSTASSTHELPSW